MYTARYQPFTAFQTCAGVFPSFPRPKVLPDPANIASVCLPSLPSYASGTTQTAVNSGPLAALPVLALTSRPLAPEGCGGGKQYLQVRAQKSKMETGAVAGASSQIGHLLVCPFVLLAPRIHRKSGHPRYGKIRVLIRCQA